MHAVKRMLLDMSSICWMSLLAGKDAEFGRKVEHEGKTVLVNSAEHGYECAMNHITTAMKRLGIVPTNMILAVEGENSKALRRAFYPAYKDSRDSRPPEAYEEFNRLKEMLVQTFLDVGAQSVTQRGIETDDVLAYLAQNLDGEVYVLTNDKDLSVLVGGNVHVYRGGELDENPLGPFPHKHSTLYLSLVGDSDEFPGAKGFGPKAFLDLLCVFGEDGLKAMTQLIETRQLHQLADDVAELKVLQKVIDSADMVYTSYACAKLYPNKVNTLRNPLVWRAGMVKRLSKMTDERLRPWAGRVRLIHAGNYAESVTFFQENTKGSPFIALDIETSTCDESDDWLVEAKKKALDDERLGVDVFGSDLTGLALTFGDNLQYTFYYMVDHVETETCKNIEMGQMLDVLKMIPKDIDTVVHNDGFELTVLKRAFAYDEAWQDNGWHGFLPNVRDTHDVAAYVDENEPTGLKKLSKRVLNYDQVSYDQVTRMQGAFNDLPPGGRVIQEVETPEGTHVIKSYRMRELTGEHVLNYGADDTICTAAFMVHGRIIMELEKTWSVFLEVEQKAAYLSALAFVDGVNADTARLKELEKSDDAVHAAAWEKMRSFLLAHQWEGTVCPVIEGEPTPAQIKEAFTIVTGENLVTQKRKLERFPEEIRAAAPENPKAEILAMLVEARDWSALNKFVADNFTGEPQINFDSPKQMQNLFYNVLNLPVRIVNKLTPKQRQDLPDLAKAVSKFNKIQQGSSTAEPLTPEELQLLKVKAATDDTAVAFALAYDTTENKDAAEILDAISSLKTIETRRKLYYYPYPKLVHWKDRKLHSSLNQNQAVTGRYSSSGPNLQQMPKKGEGVKIREVLVPHCRDGVIISLDFTGQELRSAAEQSQDPNMLACYIGDKLKDLHSLTAAGAMRKKWGNAEVDHLFAEYGADLEGPDAEYDLFVRLHKMGKDSTLGKKADDLRKVAKNVNFGSQYDAQALKLSQQLVIPVADAQAFLDARAVMYPGIDAWKESVREFVTSTGYVTTMMGRRRHLRDSVLSQDKWIVEAAGRQAPNFKIQGSSAEQTKVAMGRLWDSGVFSRCNARFIAPIHDELVVSAHKDDILEVAQAMFEAMTSNYAGMRVPNVASISFGPNFGVQYEVGDSIDAVLIMSTIDKIFEKGVSA